MAMNTIPRMIALIAEIPGPNERSLAHYATKSSRSENGDKMNLDARKTQSKTLSLLIALVMVVSYQLIEPSDHALAADPTTSTQITFSNYTSQIVNGATKEILTTKYILEIEHPQYVFCTSYCEIPVRYKYTPGTATYAYDSIELVDSSGKTFDYFFPSFTSTWTSKTLSSYSSLSSNSNLTFKTPTAGYGERVSVSSAGVTKIFAVATPETHTFNGAWPGYVEKFQSWVASYESKWRGLEFEVPTRVVAYEDCQQIPLNIASIDFDSGASNTADSTQGASVEVTLLDPDSVTVGSTSISPGYSEWTSKAPNEQISYQACGLNLKMGVAMNYSFQISYTLTQAGKTISGTSSYPVRVVGGLKFTKINCLKGSYVKVVDAYNPECPVGYEETKLPVSGNRLATKSINCIKGTTVKVVTSPTPSCPAGFKKTSLPVKNGKLQAQTITCVKGLKAIKVTKVLPTCPTGYRKA